MSKYFALIPAAGSGLRMKHRIPKQYLPLIGKPVIYHAIRTFCLSSKINSVFVVLASNDREWVKYDWSEFSNKLVVFHCGGETRAMSILNGLKEASKVFSIDKNDWVLVHDAARPCLSTGLLKRLLHELAYDEVGGLLATPLADTLKRGGTDERVKRTEPRKDLWQAQTPQMFRYKLLLDALSKPNSVAMTDDASAVEALDLHPKLILGDMCNLKITYSQDLALAELILQAQQKEIYDKKN